VSFFSEEQASELRNLFFETAGELLQALNEEGLQLEARPHDAETVRAVRRTVHTLKGDSAACGYTELSGLAHVLEDALTPELAQRRGARVAEVVLNCADVFAQMLAAYRNQSVPPAGDSIRQQIADLVKGADAPVVVAAAKPLGAFAWTEYQSMVIADAASRGLKVSMVSIALDPNCAIRAGAVQMLRTALQDLGSILVTHPEEGAPVENVDVLEAALTTSYDGDHIAKKLRIPSISADVLVKRFEAAPQHTPAAATVDETAKSETEQVQSSIAATPENLLRVDAEKIDSILNLVGELIIGKSMLMQTFTEFDKRFSKDPIRGRFSDALAFQARVLSDLQKSVMKVRMVPVEQLFRRFPRVVRDVSKAVGKDVRLAVSGQDTDLDKGILDMLAEPMAHLVRNAISHGIESPEERAAAGKPVEGTIKLDAYHQGNSVVIQVADDGKGIDRNRVVEKAVLRGIISAEDSAKLSETEALNLIFHPGLSTAEEVTAISGRGVGMDVVKSVLERLKGDVRIESQPGQGTTFFLRVPLTLAIIKALMFRVADKLYAIPLTSVVEITRAQETDIHRVDAHEVFRLREQVLTLVRLNRLTKVKGEGSNKIFVVIVALGDHKFGLVVDRLIGEEELVIKALDDHLVATEFVSGASILGDGTVVLILNLHAVVAKLARAAARAQEASA
jgi:two-component system chemotaxis sensor kinase CheA